MNVESVRYYALALNPHVQEMIFAETWISWRIANKWFLLMQLDAPEPRIAVKLEPERAIELRETNAGIRPAYHMNKRHWNDLYLDQLDNTTIQHLISESFNLVADGLPKHTRIQLGLQ